MADLGDTLNFRADLYDKPVEQGGVLSNAVTAALTITLPDGTTAAGITVTNPPVITGKYLYDYVTSPSGPSGAYVGKWLFTMGSGQTTSYVETFDVGGSLITVDEAAAHLRAQGIIVTANDLEQLQWLCFVASDEVEGDLNLVLRRRTVVETFDGGCYELNFSTLPPRASDGGSITISSVVESGTTIDNTGYVLRKKPRWRLLRGTSTSPTRWARGYENITVTYAPGCINPPRVARSVALNVLQTKWQASQQAEHPFLDEVARRASLATLSTSVLPSLSVVEQRAYMALKSVNSA